MCKVVDDCIRRGVLQFLTYNHIGSRVWLQSHYIKGVIVSKKTVGQGVIIIVKSDPESYHRGVVFQRLWYGNRGPCGIIYPGRDNECDQMVKEYFDANEAGVFFSGGAKSAQVSHDTVVMYS